MSNHVPNEHHGLVPQFTVTDGVSDSGEKQKILDIQYREGNGVRCVLVGCNEDNVPVEKDITYKFMWDMSRVAKEWDAGEKVTFTHLVTPRYESQSTFIGTHRIGTTMTANVANARTLQLYLLGRSIKEELRYDIGIPRVDETQYKTIMGFRSSQLLNPSLAYMMEQRIMRLVDEWKDNQPCTHCEASPCGWSENKDSMLTWDLATNDADAETKIRHKEIYRQMALIINGGPMGREVRMQLPCCVVEGVRALFPDQNVMYMGHKDE